MKDNNAIFPADKKILSVIQALTEPHSRCICEGIENAQGAYLLSYGIRHLERSFTVVLPAMADCEKLAEDLSFFTGPDMVEAVIFPPYNVLPFKRLSYHSETAARRLRILYQMALGSRPLIVLTPVETLLQRLIPKSVLTDYAELLMINEEVDRDGLIEKLQAGGYTQVSLVEEPGEYSIRGGIMDIFSPMYADPVRVELFGDMVESIRFFSAETQRKLQHADEAIILPAKEAVLGRAGLVAAISRIREYGDQFGLTRKQSEEMIDQISQQGNFPGIESLLPLIYEQTDSLFDYVPDATLWTTVNPGEMEKAALEKENQSSRNYLTACDENRICVNPEKLYINWATAQAELSRRARLVFKPLALAAPGDKDAVRISFDVKDNAEVSAKLLGDKKHEEVLRPLADWITKMQSTGLLTVMVCGTRSQADRLKSLLVPYDIDARITESPFPRIRRRPEAVISLGTLSAGFVWEEERFALIVEKEIFGAKSHPRRTRKRKFDVHTDFIDFGELNAGDLVVHTEHGIGVYRGLEKLSIERAVNDYLLIEYQGGDKLYIPVDRLGMVQKYLGIDGIEPVIDKMGGKSWQKVKAKTEQSVEKIAGELLDLYAARKVMPGHRFSPADRNYADFEAGFPYEETPDQLNAIGDVNEDMESEIPMDRLICGDVGYGKTEVSIRAAFKAVSEGKQVAVLVPTTILAEQHGKTFAERFSRYPIIIDCLSRFRSRKEQRDILERMKTGRSDIVIGTHRLLQKDIAFKDLGLIVIDEEQRFGVKHKEKLKRMRSSVDVLSMTATPIPRTLHMSLLGVRDISVIQTPPEFRRSIISYISEFDPAVITEAIRKEIARGGQIFFVHNNIHTIWNMARHLQDLVPEVRLGVAHGRLSENELEEVMFKFLNNEIDMLVCTTIIESGLDIPNANTMIINRADRFGLAQIYQLRGRVGRSDEQAYAYLFVPKEAALSKDAYKRLKVLMEHTDLGAGFQIAMNDLKIRGGGAALGVAQSGKIAAVGYDMFLRLLSDAVSRMKGETVVEKLEPEINVPLSVFIPESYIPDIDQRMLAYRRLSKMTELKEAADFKSELTDRYGEPPEEAKNLLLKIMLRILAIKAGVKKLDLNENLMYLTFSQMHQKHPFKILDLVASSPSDFQFTADETLRVRLKAGRWGAILAQSKNILIQIGEHVNH